MPRLSHPAFALCAALSGTACYSGVEFADGQGDEVGPGEEEQDELSSDLAAISGLRRMTVDEYDNTVRDLLGDPTRPGAQLLPADFRNPFDNDYQDQFASQSLIEGAEILAEQAAQRLVADPQRRATLVGCEPESAVDEACFRDFIGRFGRLAFRRSLTDDEVDRYAALISFADETDDFFVGIETVLRAMLQDPQFLYRVEVGEPIDGEPGLYRLGPEEMATRLAFFLWGSTPSSWLIDLAEAGELETEAQLREVAETMLEDPRARVRFGRFHAMWLGYEQLPHGAELNEGMRTETQALIDRVLFDDQRPWQDLLTEEQTFVDAALAEHYGLPAPAEPDGDWVSYTTDLRRGLLSHGSFLSVGAKFGDTSPTQRGILIRTRLFCQDLPPPPPDVNPDDPVEGGDAVCKWDRYEVHRQGGCAGCHDQMDPIGFGLENFDQQGRYRTHDNGLPQCSIEGQGEIAGVGSFEGPAGLSTLMLEAGLLDECVATQLYRFTVGRHELDTTDRALIHAWTAGAGDPEQPFRFDELIVQLVSSPAYRHRREEP